MYLTNQRVVEIESINKQHFSVRDNIILPSQGSYISPISSLILPMSRMKGIVNGCNYIWKCGSIKGVYMSSIHMCVHLSIVINIECR